MKDNDDRVLIFTQFTMVLDIMEQYLRIRGHKYLRLDGSTPVQERFVLILNFFLDIKIFYDKFYPQGLINDKAN